MRTIKLVGLVWFWCIGTGIAVSAQLESFVDEGIVPNIVPETTADSILYQNSAPNMDQNIMDQNIILAQASSVGSNVESEVGKIEVDEGGDDDDSDSEESDTSGRSLVDSLPWSAAPTAVGTGLVTESTVGGNTAASLSPPVGARPGLEPGFFPRLTLSFSHEDNPAKFPGQDDETDAALSISPTLNYRNTINNRHPYELGVGTTVKEYDEFSKLDFNDFTVYGALQLDISEKLIGDIYAGHVEVADRRGATAARTLDFDIDNDDYEKDIVGGRLTIGRRSNTLQLVLRAEEQELDFTNNNQDHRDREDSRVGAALHWNVGPRTSIFLDADLKDVDYLASTQNGFDSEETKTTMGVGWEPSFNTSVIFQIGNLEKDFSDPGLQDYDDTTYSGRLSWSPQDGTGVNLYANLTTEEAVISNSSYIESELIGISANHDFTSRIGGDAFANFINDDHSNLIKDDNTDYGIGLNYSLTHWISLGASWTHNERESSLSERDFESNTYSLIVQIVSPN